MISFIPGRSPSKRVYSSTNTAKVCSGTDSYDEVNGNRLVHTYDMYVYHKIIMMQSVCGFVIPLNFNTSGAADLTTFVLSSGAVD